MASNFKIDYSGIICVPPTPMNEDLRFVLKKKGNKTLFVIGLNSSTANESKPDRTVRKAMKIAMARGFDGFVMLNLYPLRETTPSDLPKTDEQKLVEKNVAEIRKELAKVPNPTILAAWGTNIEERHYLRECLQKIIRLTAVEGVEWKHFGSLTKDGHPRHLLYVPEDSKLSSFDIEKYAKTLE